MKNQTKKGVIITVASTKGIIFDGCNTYFNPDKEIKDQISNKLIGKEVEVEYRTSAGRNYFSSIKVIDPAKELEKEAKEVRAANIKEEVVDPMETNFTGADEFEPKEEDTEILLFEKLGKIQVELKAPKVQNNNFANFKYRSCSDILEALKHLLKKYNVSIVITDSIEMIGGRYYVKSIAILADNITGESINASAYAREQKEKKGMDDAQVTGAASSYARKYALNGLFAIDDTTDADGMENK